MSRLPGHGALWLDQRVEFVRTVFIGDLLEVRGTVKRKVVAERALVLDPLVTNQRGETVVSGTAKVRAPEPRRDMATAPEHPPESRVALVTGASRGIGAAIARELAMRKFRVAIAYHERKAEAEAVGAEIRREGGAACTIQADLTAPGSVAALVREALAALGGRHVVVNNAAIPYAPAHAAHYVAAKAAPEGLTRALAVEHEPRNVRVNMFSSGMVPTELIQATPEGARTVYAMQTPPRRLAEADDVARVVAFLASDEARHLTGVNVPVSGGRALA